MVFSLRGFSSLQEPLGRLVFLWIYFRNINPKPQLTFALRDNRVAGKQKNNLTTSRAHNRRTCSFCIFSTSCFPRLKGHNNSPLVLPDSTSVFGYILGDKIKYYYRF